MPVITMIYASLTVLLLAGLSLRVSMLRLKMHKASGDVSDGRLINAIRLQANLTEYAPMAMIMLLLHEILKAPMLLIHLYGVMFLFGRILHVIGFASRPQKLALRQLSMVLTYAMLTFSGLSGLFFALF